MVQPRDSRKKAVVISSDEEDSSRHGLPSDQSEAHAPPVKPQKRVAGKLKPVKKVSRQQLPTLVSSTQDASPQKSPAKPKIAKSKSRIATKDQPKPNGRPIYSFFNTATSKQQTPNTSGSPEKQVVLEEDPDAIHDESDDATSAGVQPSKGSSVALAMRKRKLGQSESFETDASLPLPGSQKFRKASSGERLPSLSVFNEDKRPWTEQFAPSDLSELAVHRAKVSDVRKWLEAALSGRRQKVLVLKGSAGTGKTATIRLLAQEMKLQTIEWKNPAMPDQTSEETASTASQFQEFLGRAGRSGGLQFSTSGSDEDLTIVDKDKASNDRRQLLLVEEFPSTFSRALSTLQSFRSTILQYLSSPSLTDASPTPIVMVVSETLLSTSTALADSFTAHRLLGPELINHPFLDTIEFNAVARTILTKGLETIAVKEARKSGRRNTPGPQVIKQLAESGDIRSAISSLEFLCLRGDNDETWSSKVTFTKQKKAKAEPAITKYEEDALKLICNRESTLGIFHAVGKVMYNKRQESTPSDAHPPSWLPQHRRSRVWENDIDEILNELGTDIPTFVAALHENYALSCSSASTVDTLDSLLNGVNSISDADLLSVERFSFGTRAFSGSATDSLRQDEMSFQTVVRGLLFNFPFPVTRIIPPGGKRGDERQMFYPTSLKLWRKREEAEGTLDLLISKFASGSIGGLTDIDLGPSAGSSGVENWKRNTDVNENADRAPGAPGGLASLRSSSVKAEMLTECLPYMAQILSSRASPRVLGSIQSVTRVRGAVSTVGDDDTADEDEGDSGANPEQWSTNRPETESAQKTSTNRTGVKKKRQIKGTEGGGLAIPAESRVEKLVLEDDDIVDD